MNSSEEYNFNKFSNLPFYTEINAKFLEFAKIDDQKTIVDLGCGTGGITKLLIDRLKNAKETVIYAIDHSKTALKTAANEIEETKNILVKFCHSEVQSLTDVIKDKVDAIVYCNSIHYVPDKSDLLTKIKSKLNNKGILAFNTSFFEGSHPEDSLEFFRKWMLRSLRKVKKEYGISAKKSNKVESRVQLNQEEYKNLLLENGFEINSIKTNRIDVPIEGWHHISGFSDWIEGILPGIPLDIGRDVLQKSLAEIWEELKLNSIPRIWLSVSASPKV
ncbi:MAG: hypothetical protein CL740_06545 [Chloroflexi bacterium]|nr:hypothetical protein [Chloroflexota bacterium]|tara:strand:+ start:4424 stop:5248 length:825 start_codon:yes stop_codon:yes gene_type:complete